MIETYNGSKLTHFQWSVSAYTSTLTSFKEPESFVHNTWARQMSVLCQQQNVACYEFFYSAPASDPKHFLVTEPNHPDAKPAGVGWIYKDEALCVLQRKKLSSKLQTSIEAQLRCDMNSFCSWLRLVPCTHILMPDGTIKHHLGQV